MAKRIIAIRLYKTRSLILRGPPSKFQKIEVMKGSPRRESGVHLQRMSALKCVLLLPVDIGLFILGSLTLDLCIFCSNSSVQARVFGWRGS